VRLERGKTQSLIAIIESGERKLDVCKFVDYADAIGVNPTAITEEDMGSSGTQ